MEKLGRPDDTHTMHHVIPLIILTVFAVATPYERSQAAESVDVAKLIVSTPELVAKGKDLYAQNCVACHGNEGKGDGAAAAALTPKPRNLASADGWKFGRGVANIFKTLTNGSPGTSMPPFAGLSVEARFAISHYVRTLTPNAPEDKSEDVALLQKELGTPAKPTISIERAMDKMAQEWAASHPSN